MDDTNLDLQVQVQIEIGKTRRAFFTHQPSNYQQLIDAIKQDIPKTTFMDFGLQSEDDQGDYVVLNSSDELSLRVAITSAKNIPGTEIRCLKLRLFVGSWNSFKLKVELDNKKSAIAKSKGTLCSKVECALFQASLLRKHVFAVEKYCKQHLEGRLPAKQDISKILESALSEDTSSSLRYHRAKQCQSGKRKHDTPFKPQLEKYGIQFPDKRDKCSTTSM